MSTIPTDFVLGSGVRITTSTRPDDGLLDQFFVGYDAAFTLDSEKETIEGLRDCLAQNSGTRAEELARNYGRFCETILVASDSRTGCILGGADFFVVDHSADERSDRVPRHTMHLSYIFVDKASRGRGLSGELLAACAHAASGIASQWEGRRSGAEVVTLLEMNDPFKLTPEQAALDTLHAGIDQFARLRYWDKCGVRLVDHAYTQPALSAVQVEDDTLALVRTLQEARTVVPLIHMGENLDGVNPSGRHSDLRSALRASPRHGQTRRRSRP